MTPTIHDVAAEVAQVAADHGFQRVSWENLPIKLVLTITELDEAVEAAGLDNRALLAEEMADTAIRLLGCLHDLYGREWCSLVESRRLVAGHSHPWEPVERLVWPVVRNISGAVEAWRDDNHKDAQISVELALLETFRASDRMGINLFRAIAEKTRRNRERPLRHGRARDEG